MTCQCVIGHYGVRTLRVVTVTSTCTEYIFESSMDQISEKELDLNILLI